MEKRVELKIIDMFEKWSGQKAQTIFALPESGSYREYVRVQGGNLTAVGVYNQDVKENRAFVYYSRHFKQIGLPVPEIYADREEDMIYLQEDLGDQNLFEMIKDRGNDADLYPEEMVRHLKYALDILPKVQVEGAKGLDFSYGYPRAAFDKQSMLWDLSYFKYYFLKLARISFDEQDLENDFETLVEFLLSADSDYFLFRDFQTSNIMIHKGMPYLIDYQGGRKGALHYDLASLLYDAKANIPPALRLELYDHYLNSLEKYIPVDRAKFSRTFYGFVLIRVMQAMGAFGFRGFYEKKERFLDSIPYALDNLDYIIREADLPIDLPELWKVLRKLVASDRLRNIRKEKIILNISINSFSYHRGIPVDVTGHGGGYVFDCRAIHNPGRYEQYKNMTGQDSEVVAFFEKESNAEEYLQDVESIIDKSVRKYQERNYTQLMINFGCTGGRHRSVYCAEKLGEFLKERHRDISVSIKHLELQQNDFN